MKEGLVILGTGLLLCASIVAGSMWFGEYASRLDHERKMEAVKYLKEIGCLDGGDDYYRCREISIYFN